MASALTSYCFETAAFKPNLRLPARETEQFPGRCSTVTENPADQRGPVRKPS